jgi:hypothetical protein
VEAASQKSTNSETEMKNDERTILAPIIEVIAENNFFTET